MNLNTDEIDELIARKRQELKDLIQDEIDELVSLRDGVRYGVGEPPPPSAAAEARTASLRAKANTPALKSKYQRKTPKRNATASIRPSDSRLSAIAAAAKRVSGNSRTRYSVEKKFEILDEYDAAPVKARVIAKHGVSAQSVGKWKIDVAAGLLVRPE